MEINKDILTDEGKILFDLNNIFINKNRKIELLNKIIDELEKYLNEDDWTSVNGVIAVNLIKNKLNILKGDNK